MLEASESIYRLPTYVSLTTVTGIHNKIFKPKIDAIDLDRRSLSVSTVL